MDASKITMAVEIKWSDRALENSREIKGLLDLAEEHELAGLKDLVCRTLSKAGVKHTAIKTFCSSLQSSSASRWGGLWTAESSEKSRSVPRLDMATDGISRI